MVEHTLGKGGVASPILASGTIFDISALMADFLFLNKRLFSPILEILKLIVLEKLSDFLFSTLNFHNFIVRRNTICLLILINMVPYKYLSVYNEEKNHCY